MVKHSGAAEHDGREDEGEMERSEALEVCLFSLALLKVSIYTDYLVYNL